MPIRRSLVSAGLAAALMLSSGASMAFVTVGVSITLAPPALPVYEQPPIPEPGYMWVPGYWAWADGGYYWVPGTWVLPPRAGFLWTPGYWGWNDGRYVWNPGYWGSEVGFYGGIDYGFGYTGVGYQGGYWDHDRFFYNRAVNNVRDVHITNVYNRTVVNNITVNRISYNGGHGGVSMRPTPGQLAAARGPHVQAVAEQERQEQAAAREPQLHDNVNHGRPPIAATPRSTVFTGRGVVTARGEPMSHPAAQRPEERTHATGSSGQESRAPAYQARPAPSGAAPQMNRSAPSGEHSGAPHAPAPDQYRGIPERRNAAPPAARELRPAPRPEAREPAPRPEARESAPRPQAREHSTRDEHRPNEPH